MKNSFLKLTLVGFAALAIAALPLQAANEDAKAEKAKGKAKKEEAAEKPANPNRAIPFHGKLTAKTDSSVSVGERTFEVNAETKIMKDGKPATLADGVIGEPIGGSYREVDGKKVAKSVRLGAKPEAADKAEKPEKAPKAEKPEKEKAKKKE